MRDGWKTPKRDYLGKGRMAISRQGYRQARAFSKSIKITWRVKIKDKMIAVCGKAMNELRMRVNIVSARHARR